jgi:cytochrome c biogenesis protein CcdA
MLGIIVLAHAVIAGVYAYVLTNWDQMMADQGIGGDSESQQIADVGKGVVVFFIGLAAVFAILGLVLLLQYAKGGNAVRVCSIVYASFAIITGIFTLAVYGLGLLIIIISILLIVFAAKRATAEWFRRPRY